MSWTDRLIRTFDPDPLDTALDDELRFHPEQRTDEFIARGMTPGEARREAALLFGNRTAVRESTRDRDLLVWLEGTLQDARYACEACANGPDLQPRRCSGWRSASAPPAHPHPEQLVQLKTRVVYGSTFGNDTFSYPLGKDIRDGNQVFSGVLGRYLVTLSVAFGSHSERVDGATLRHFARRYYGNRSPAGHMVGLGNDLGLPADLEIVGAVDGGGDPRGGRSTRGIPAGAARGVHRAHVGAAS